MQKIKTFFNIVVVCLLLTNIFVFAKDTSGMAFKYFDFIWAKKYKEAEKIMKKVIKINEKEKGDSHQDVAFDYVSLSEVYVHTKKFDKAIECYNKAIAILAKNPDVPAIIVDEVKRGLEDIKAEQTKE